MSDPHRDQPSDAPLNPALKSRKETIYDTTSTTPTPFDSASAKEGEGEGWPIIWLVVTVICVVLAVYFIL
ncbi:MAG TPA: hypothetical protein VFO69_00510 [Allosphingosinicella sp.]|nr:hypothetical protein [Allosphingosinicella sp.]